MPNSHCCAVGTRLDTSLHQDALMECCSLCSTGWGAMSRGEWWVGITATTNTVTSQCKLLSQLLWTQLCSSGLPSALSCSSSDHRKLGRSGYCISVVVYSLRAGWTLVFIHQSLLHEHLSMDMSLLPCLRVQMTQHKEYFRCGSMLSVPLGPSGWLPVGKPRVPGLFTLGLPPRKARRHLHVPGVNLGACLQENRSHLCSSVQQENICPSCHAR